MNVPPLPESPCVRQCTLNEADVCLGCGRTLAEILDWSALDAPARERVLELAADRRRELRERSGGVWRA